MAKRGRPRINRAPADASVIAGTDIATDNASVGTSVADDGAGTIENIDPGSVDIERDAGDVGTGSDAGTGDQPKRRGRKPGSAARKTGKTLDLNGVEGLLLSIHAGVAAITKIPEANLDKAEARSLAEGMNNVARHYDIGASQKAMDWANLVGICAMVYGSRMFAYRARMAAQKPKAAPRSAPPPVPPGNTQPGIIDGSILGAMGNGVLTQ